MGEIERFVALPTDSITRQVRALGIDLGTTNSTVSEVVWEPGNAPICTVLELAQPTQAGEYRGIDLTTLVDRLTGRSVKKAVVPPSETEIMLEKIALMHLARPQQNQGLNATCS